MYLANVADFIAFVGQNEAIQLTQAGSPDMNTVNTVRIQSGLDQARDLLEQQVSINWPLFKICQLRVARSILDPYTHREVVEIGYNQAWQWVNQRERRILWT